MNDIEIVSEDLQADDAHLWEVTASRHGVEAKATSRDESKATREAIRRLNAKENALKNLSPDSPNFESDLIAFLSRPNREIYMAGEFMPVAY